MTLRPMRWSAAQAVWSRPPPMARSATLPAYGGRTAAHGGLLAPGHRAGTYLPRNRWLCCRASSDQDSNTEASEGGSGGSSGDNERGAVAEKEAPKMKKTLNSLNAILGIDEEAERAEKEAKENKDLGLDRPKGDWSIASQKDSEDEGLKGVEGKKVDVENGGDMAGETNKRVTRLMDVAKKLREGQDVGKQDEAGTSSAEDAPYIWKEETEFRKEFESLLTYLAPDGGISKEDIKMLKDKVFTPQNFWVTETRQTEERDGFLIRGNLRGPAEKVYEEVITKTRDLFGGKYEILVIQDPDQQPEGADMTVKPAFKLVPVTVAYPQPASSWQVVAGLVLLVLTVGSSLQLGLVAEISKLPAETLQWLLNPDNLNKVDAVPPGLEDFDAVGFVAAAWPIALCVLGLQGTHDVGHRIAALINGTKLGPPFWIPNGQLGTFGSITQIKSLLRNHAELFDVAAAGPVAGSAASLGIFLYGLAISAAADPATADALVPVPEQVLQSSLGLGSLTHVFLGEAAKGSQVLVHPLVVAGWVGLYTNALNLLPVGSLDGGRMVQAAFGKSSLVFTSFFSYIGLALGLFGGSLALPFGLYVLILNRVAESYIQDSVTEVSEGRKTLTALLVFTAIVVLLPAAPEAADDLMSGGANFF